MHSVGSLKTLQIVGASLLMGMLVMSILPWLIPLPDGSSNLSAQIFLAAAGGLMLPVCLILRKVLMGSLALGLSQVMALGKESDPQAEDLKRYSTGTLVGMALSEAVVIFGFVMAFLTGEAGKSLLFVGVGCFMAVVQFPRESGLQEVARARAERSP